MGKKIIKILALATLLLILPIAISYATNSFSEQDTYDKNSDALTLQDAEILVMMNTDGQLIDSHVIHNLNDEKVYLIHIKGTTNDLLFLVNQEGEVDLVEES